MHFWKAYPRERTSHFLEPHANPLIQKRPLRQRFCCRGVGYYPCLRLFEEMVRHGHAKDSPNLRFTSPASRGYLGKCSGFPDWETEGEAKPIDCLQGWRPQFLRVQSIINIQKIRNVCNFSLPLANWPFE